VTTTYPSSLNIQYVSTSDLPLVLPTTPITWGYTMECSLLWKGGRCNGVDAPWGLLDMVDDQTTGSQMAWKWLADYNASTSAIMSIEKGDKLNIMVYEYLDKVPTVGFDTWEPAVIKYKID
jgi:hypothetical protein